MRMMNVLRPHRVGALLALIGLVLVAVDAYPQNFVVTSYVEPSSVAAGETVDLNVNFKLAEGVHLYTPEQFGIDPGAIRRQWSDYIERFGIPPE